MKTIRSLALMLAVIVTGTLYSGCAGAGSSSTESTLSAAGFVSRTPETTQQRQLFDALPSYQLHRGTWKGKTLYAYKDEKKGLAFIGDESAYQRYQQLAVQQRIANDYRSAAEMNRDSAFGWYGAYGPYIGPRPVVVIRR
ncbi:MAG: hypothetical protein QM755_18470 [Luteolibacter sp.]